MKMPPTRFRIDVRYTRGGEWAEFAVRASDEAYRALAAIRERGLEARLVAVAPTAEIA